MNNHFTTKFTHHSFRLPHLGQRIIKTGIAVFLCLLIYWLRGYGGLVMQSTVAAIICIQPYRADSISTSVNRIISTFVGAGWAALFLLLMAAFKNSGIGIHVLLAYGIMSIGIMLSIYSCVLMKNPDAASLAAVVFICILGTYPDLDQPFLYMLNRIIDTVIGIVVAGLVNSVSLPRKKHENYLFFIHMHDLVPDRYAHINSTVLVILNRLYDEGAKICLISKWAPAFMISQMGTMNINVPVIVMDGAALYDIADRSYLHVTPIAHEDALELIDLLRGMGLAYGACTVREDSLMIYRGGKMSRAETKEHELMKRSPYRNYVEGPFSDEDQVCFLRVIDYDEIIEELEVQFRDMISPSRFRFVRRPHQKMEGYSGLYFYHPEATVENCMEYLLEEMSKKEGKDLVPIDMSMPKCYESEHQAIALLNRVRHIYEPVRLPWN